MLLNTLIHKISYKIRGFFDGRPRGRFCGGARDSLKITIASFDGDIETTLDVTATLLTQLDSNFGITIGNEAIGDIGCESELFGI